MDDACCNACDELKWSRRDKWEDGAGILAMRETGTGCAAPVCEFTSTGGCLSFQLGQRTGGSSRAVATATMSDMAGDAGGWRSRERTMVVRGVIAKRAPNCSWEVRDVGWSTVEWYRRTARERGERRKRGNGYEATVTDVVSHCRRSISRWRLSICAFVHCTNTHGSVAQ